MPNIKSAKKELRKSVVRRKFNNAIEENLKTLLKKSRTAVETGDTKAAELIKTTLKALDKAAQKGVIKKNNSKRKKSRLQKKLNRIIKK